MDSTFASELRKTWRAQNRTEVGRQISRIPKTHWSYIPEHQLAIVSYQEITIFIHVLSGGTGINTYDRATVRISWADGTEESLGTFSADDLKTPNYVSKEERLLARQRMRVGEHASL